MCGGVESGIWMDRWLDGSSMSEFALLDFLHHMAHSQLFKSDSKIFLSLH